MAKKQGLTKRKAVMVAAKNSKITGGARMVVRALFSGTWFVCPVPEDRLSDLRMESITTIKLNGSPVRVMIEGLFVDGDLVDKRADLDLGVECVEAEIVCLD